MVTTTFSQMVTTTTTVYDGTNTLGIRYYYNGYTCNLYIFTSYVSFRYTALYTCHTYITCLSGILQSMIYNIIIQLQYTVYYMRVVQSKCEW